MKVSEFIAYLKLHRYSDNKTMKLSVEGYGETTEDFALFINGDNVTISIAKPTEKNYQEGLWVKDANL